VLVWSCAPELKEKRLRRERMDGSGTEGPGDVGGLSGEDGLTESRGNGCDELGVMDEDVVLSASRG
jgi:hypothetical protein